MRRLFVFLLLLTLIVAIGLIVYAYVSDLPAPRVETVTPAAGVGFSD